MLAVLKERATQDHRRRCEKPIFIRTSEFVLAIGVCGSASASTLFDFANVQASSTGNSFGNSLSFMVGGITVTETAWYLPNTAGATKFSTAAVDNYSGTNLGLGVCSSNDPSGASCSSPYHQIDSANTSGLPGGDEFVMFKFSTAVNLSSIQVTNYSSSDGSTAVDLSYYTASTALTTSTTLSSLGTGTTVNNNAGSGNQVTVAATGTDVTYLIIGASVADAGTTVDSFKLNALTVSAFATPEPGTFATLGLGLLGLGIAGLRRPRRIALR